TCDELLRRAGELVDPGAAAGDCLDRATSPGAGVVPWLHGCVLGADADLARCRAAGADPAQSAARRACAFGPLKRGPVVTCGSATVSVCHRSENNDMCRARCPYEECSDLTVEEIMAECAS